VNEKWWIVFSHWITLERGPWVKSLGWGVSHSHSNDQIECQLCMPPWRLWDDGWKMTNMANNTPWRLAGCQLHIEFPVWQIGKSISIFSLRMMEDWCICQRRGILCEVGAHPAILSADQPLHDIHVYWSIPEPQLRCVRGDYPRSYGGFDCMEPLVMVELSELK